MVTVGRIRRSNHHENSHRKVSSMTLDTFPSSLVIEALQCLEGHLGVHRSHLAHVVSALSGGHYASAMTEADHLRNTLGSVVVMCNRLHDNVVPADGLGRAVESIGELALRARRLVIIRQIAYLRDVLREPAASSRARNWFIGRFESIHDVATFFHDELHRINAIWIQYREDDAAPHISSTDRVTLYRASVRVAQRALRDLLEQPDLAQFLRAGLAMADWPAVHTAFTEIAAALAVQVDTVSGRHPIVPPLPSRVAAPGSAGES
jgi:hypothetical protein